MNIDILCEFGSMNGGENSLAVLLPILRERGIEFRVLAPETGPFAETIRSFGIELIPFEPGSGRPLSVKRERLAEILKRKRTDLLHANSLSMGRLSGPVAEELKLPGVSHLRDIIGLNRTMIADLNRHRRLLAVSEATKRFHIGQGLDASRCFTMYNGIDLDRFKPGPPTGFLHRELNIPDYVRFIGAVGQIGLRKGLDRLLPALRPLFKRRNDLHLAIVGQRWSGKEESLRFEEDLRTESHEKPFRGRVHFLGVRNDVDRLMNEWTILVHPARQEPLGRVLLEAAASGLPVVATDVGGTREIFTDPDTERLSARLVSEMEFGKISDEIEKILDDSDLGTRCARDARHRMERCFSKELAAQTLFEHYSEVSLR